MREDASKAVEGFRCASYMRFSLPTPSVMAVDS